MSDSAKQQLAEMDGKLAQRWGRFASYTTEHDPIPSETFGDGAADETDRLLDVFAKPASQILDLGCGAGFTLCRLAPRVNAIWGFEQQEDLFAAARLRAEVGGIKNAHFVLGNVAEDNDVAQLPDDTFDFGFSRRGPNLLQRLLPKLKRDAFWLQEFWQDPLGLNGILGRRREMFLPHSSGAPDWPVGFYLGLDMLCVSAKTYYYEEYFRDVEHLANCHLGEPGTQSNWESDRQALELYARYNETSKGIRVMGTRRISLYRRRAGKEEKL